MEDYAKANKFDPLNVEKWYTSARFIQYEKVAVVGFISFVREEASPLLSNDLSEKKILCNGLRFVFPRRRHFFWKHF